MLIVTLTVFFALLLGNLRTIFFSNVLFSMEVCKGLLHMIYLQSTPCDSLMELIQSTLLRVDQSSKGMTTLCKLIFTAFI